MSVRLLLLRHSAAVSFVLCLGVVAPQMARAADPQPSTPESREAVRERNSEVLTNLSNLSTRKDFLREMEDELNRSFRNFTPNSLDGIAAPRLRAAPVVPNPKVKELLDKRKNWTLSTPEEILNAPDPDKIFNADKDPTRTSRKAQTADDFLNSLNNGNGVNSRKFGGSMEGAGVFVDPSKSSGGPGGGDEKDSRMPEGLRGTEEGLRRLLVDREGTTFNAPSARSSFSDFFGLGERETPKEQDDARKAYLKEYEQMLNTPGPAVSPMANQMNPMLGPELPNRMPGFKGMDNTLTRRSSSDAQLGMINPLLIPNPAADVNTKVLNGWNPLQTAPTPTVAAPKPTPSPSFQAPRRSF